MLKILLVLLGDTGTADIILDVLTDNAFSALSFVGLLLSKEIGRLGVVARVAGVSHDS